MKRDGRQMSEAEVFDAVADAILYVSGPRRARIVPEARLMEDLGVYGDDAYDLLCRLDDAFVMQPGEVDVAIHFGREGLGAPLLPWQADRDVGCYEPQPMTVEELVHHIRAGQWPTTLRIPRARSRHIHLKLASWIQFGIVVIAFAVMLLGLLSCAAAE